MKFLSKSIAVLILICLSVSLSYAAYAKEGLTIHFIDVGQADAAIILCDDEVMMIDGGNTKDSSLIYSYLTDTLRVKHINYMIASHPHEDHIGGLAGALNACTIGMLYSPVKEYDSEAFRSLQKYAAMQELEITIPTVGESFTLGEANVQILSPERSYIDENDLSIVVRIVYGQTSVLFTGDAELAAERDLVDSDYMISSTLLKAGHHGSDTSSSSAFLREIQPKFAIISVGADNAYSHPSEVVLNRLAALEIEVLRTDLCGNIICYSNGRSFTFIE